ncbi:MAG TPA: hypothetical protein VHL57_10670, partial [Flavobacteriales bacterium]|nr:hypothetical protein [Flavobacteriales bacterium]
MLLQAQEVCDNGLDDDADGLVDLNDTTDCACFQVTTGPVTSLIPNSSFEEQDCIPTTVSELTCASGWEQATDATSDYWCTNGFMYMGMPAPLNGGIGYAGAIAMWNAPNAGFEYLEYLGACLTAPMLSGGAYSMTVDMAACWLGSTATPPVGLGPIE